MGNDGLVISNSVPDVVGKATWLKILEDGSKEWYELVDDTWTLVKSEAAPASIDHNHTALGNINFTGTVSVGGNVGLTGTRTVGAYKLTFSQGILTGIESA